MTFAQNTHRVTSQQKWTAEESDTEESTTLLSQYQSESSSSMDTDVSTSPDSQFSPFPTA
ncbi:hypothetical protein PMm318_A57980 [Pseudomonas moorei]